MTCRTTIRAPHESQKVRLVVVDLTLERRSARCLDWLSLFDGHRAATLCGRRSNVNAVTSLGRSLDVEFRSAFDDVMKGFWLMFIGEEKLFSIKSHENTS